MSDAIFCEKHKSDPEIVNDGECIACSLEEEIGRVQELGKAWAEKDDELAALRARSASDAALIERLREALRGFIEQGRSLGGSHPHFANYFSFSGAIWDDARAVLAEAERRKEGKP
jgi:hypothetical protein